MEKAWEYPGETLGNTMVILGEYSGNRTVILWERSRCSPSAFLQNRGTTDLAPEWSPWRVEFWLNPG